MSITRVVAEEGTEEALIEQARQYRAQEKPREETERDATLAAARRFAASQGVHRADGRGNFGTMHPVSATIDERVAKDAIRLGDMVIKRSVAQSQGFIDEAGRLTAKGEALAARDGGPAAASARPAAQPSRSSGSVSVFSFVALERGKSLADVSDSEITSMAKQLRSPRVGAADRAAAERDARQLESEIARRQGAEVDYHDDDEDTDEDTVHHEDHREAYDAPANPIEVLLESGDYIGAVDAAAPVISELNGSTAYRAAVDDYLAGANPSDAMVAGIAADLGISTTEAGQRVNVAMAGYQAEAAASVADILTPSQSDAFVELLVEHRQDLFNRAASAHVHHGSLVLWQSSARDFAQTISAAGDPNDYLGSHRGGEVYEEGGRYFVKREGRPAMDLYVALATGIVRPV